MIDLILTGQNDFRSAVGTITSQRRTKRNNEVEKIQISKKTPLFKYGESFCNTLISILILLFRFVYQVNRMYRFGTEVRLFF